MRKALENLKTKKNLIGAEIGVWKGENAKEMLNELDIKKLYLVDPYLEYKDNTETKVSKQEIMTDAKRNAKELLKDYKNIEWIYKKSNEALKDIKEKLDFVYIDACHNYNEVKEDIVNWTKKVKKGGLVSGHDYDLAEVKQAVDEYTKENKTSDLNSMKIGKIVKDQENRIGILWEGGSDWWFWKSP